MKVCHLLNFIFCRHRPAWLKVTLWRTSRTTTSVKTLRWTRTEAAGTTPSSSSSPALASPLGSETSGGFPISATGIELLHETYLCSNSIWLLFPSQKRWRGLPNTLHHLPDLHGTAGLPVWDGRRPVQQWGTDCSLENVPPFPRWPMNASF